MKVEFYRHNISQTDIDNVTKVLNSTFLTTGKVVEEFENKFSNYIGCKHTIGLMSCTAALHLSLLAYGIGQGDEVITTPMTFIATPNSVIQAVATPIFVDVEKDTGNIDANLIEAAITYKTKAIMPVHLYGNMVDIVKIRRIANKYNLIVIEDAAHAIESSRNGIRVGQLGDASCYSFYPTKSITSGEGGAVCTNNDKVASMLYKMRNHGMGKDASERYTGKYQHWDMDIFGWKYNMDNIKAALLVNQLDNIDKYWLRRETISLRYENEFTKAGMNFIKVSDGVTPARHLFTILVEPDKRDSIMSKLQDKGIGVAVNYRAVHLLTYYRERFGYERGNFPIAENIGDSTISIPLYPRLTDEEVEYVIKSVKEGRMLEQELAPLRDNFSATVKECKALYELAKQSRQAIVEIGSWKGYSTIWLAKGSQVGNNSFVYAIDTFEGDIRNYDKGQPDTYEEFLNNITKYGVKNRVIPKRMTSANAEKDWGTRQIGLLFIDGDHDDIANDFARWYPHLSYGGIIALHDTVQGYNLLPYKVAVNELYKSGNFINVERVGCLTFAKKVSSTSILNKLDNNAALYHRYIYQILIKYYNKCLTIGDKMVKRVTK